MKILVAVDSSSYAQDVLHEIAGRTWAKEAQFYVLTAIERCHDWDASQQYMQEAKIILEQRVAFLKKRMPHNKISGHVVEGSAATMIARTAREWNAHLIVIGSHGDTGPRLSGIGSVAAAVVNDAPCSVEVVKLVKARDKNINAAQLPEKLLI